MVVFFSEALWKFSGDTQTMPTTTMTTNQTMLKSTQNTTPITREHKNAPFSLSIYTICLVAEKILGSMVSQKNLDREALGGGGPVSFG
jgi:hypothetical protein